MSFNPQAGPKGVVSGLESINAGISPILGDIEQVVKGNSTLLMAAGFIGLVSSFLIRDFKKGPLHEVIFFGSGIIGAAGIYGLSQKDKTGSSAFAHSYYAPGMPQGPYYMPYMYNQPSPPPYPIYGAPPPYIQGPPNIHYLYGGYPQQHHSASIFDLIFGHKKKKHKKNHHHPFYPLYTQPLNSFNAYDTDVIIPKQIITGKSINGSRNSIDDSNHVFSHISDMY